MSGAPVRAPLCVPLAAFWLLASSASGGSLPSHPPCRGVGFDRLRGALLAEGVEAVAAGPVLQEARVEWVVALERGELLIYSSGEGGGPALALARARALSVYREAARGPLSIAAALEGGGVVSVDPRLGVTRLLSEVNAVALAATDEDRDGRDELLAALVGGGVVTIAVASGEVTVASEVAGAAVAAFKTLPAGSPRLAVALSAGGAVLLGAAPPQGGDASRTLIADAALESLVAATSPGHGMQQLVLLERKGDLLVIDPADGAPRWVEPREGSTSWEQRFLVLGLEAPGAGGRFLRGDANLDLVVNLSDAVGILHDLFLGVDAAATCRDALDVNDDGVINISDPIYGLVFLFSGGPPIPAPYPDPGPDPTADGLECSSGG